jgi:hypothetical protein
MFSSALGDAETSVVLVAGWISSWKRVVVDILLPSIAPFLVVAAAAVRLPALPLLGAAPVLDLVVGAMMVVLKYTNYSAQVGSSCTGADACSRFFGLIRSIMNRPMTSSNSSRRILRFVERLW